MKKTGLILLIASLCSIGYSTSLNWASASAGNWGTAANWNPAQVPTTSDDVALGYNIQITVEPGTTAEANSITMNTSALTGGLKVDSGAGLNVIGDYIQNKGILNLRVDNGFSRVIGGNVTLNTAGRISLLQKSSADYNLTIGGDLNADGNNSALDFKLNGSIGYSAITVGGTTILAEDRVDLILDTTDTSSITTNLLLLVRNSSTNAVVGSFRNAPFGTTTYTLNGTEYALQLWDYDGDDVVNDIVLTSLSAVGTASWISSVDGEWMDGSNWDIGRAPLAIDNVQLTNTVKISVSDVQAAASIVMNPGTGGTLEVQNSGSLAVIGDMVQTGGMVAVYTYIAEMSVGGDYIAYQGMSRILQGDKDSLTIAGDLTASSGYRFDFAMNSSSSGIGRIVVGGTTSLGGADLTLRSFVHNDMDVILLMHNTSTNEVVGWFDASVPTEYDLGATQNYELKLWDYDEDGYSNDIVLTTLGGAEGYAAWSDDWDVDIGSATNDYDGDGVSNLGEYGLGGNPTNILDKGYVPSFIQDGENMVYVYAQRTNDAALTYYIETCSNLVTGSWSGTGYSVLGTNTTESFSFVTNLIPAADPSKFVRLVIEQN